MVPYLAVSSLAAVALAVSSGGTASALSPVNLKGQVRSISPHDGAAFNQVSNKERTLSTVENALLNELMEDPSIGDILKGTLKQALASVVGSLSKAAKDSCEKIVDTAESKIAEASHGIEDAIESLDDGGSGTALVQEKNKSLIRSNETDEGFFDALKDKAKSAWNSVKGAAKDLMHKVGEKLRPIIERALEEIVPKLQDEASDLLGKACNLAHEKLQSVETSLSN